jgi:hypothetical protein
MRKGCVLAAAVLGAALGASIAAADIGIRKARPTVVQPGDVAHVEADGYLGPKPWPAMPVVIVKASAAPRPYRCRGLRSCSPRLRPSALRRKPFVWVGRIRRWRDRGQGSATGSLAFRVPHVEAARYVFGLYCASCTPGPSGSLIIDRRISLIVRRR